ncbi:MAG: DNA-3-methyladenine glycosylase [Acidobacteriales bacterium]|nr:DNA-3-methyladenine glycosylase [Terriglobales bacterium]
MKKTHDNVSCAGKLLRRTFYNRDPREVSRDLLGKVLVRRAGRRILAARIVEVEAYLGTDDPAAHSASGRTLRNAVLFGPPGLAYVYFIYGNHYCLNVSCLPDGVAGGVLFRAVEPISGIQSMARARGINLKVRNGNPDQKSLRNLTSGPGKLAQAFGVTRERDNGKDLASLTSDLFIMADDCESPEIQLTSRIGIRKAVDLPLRYIVPGNPFLSVATVRPAKFQ